MGAISWNATANMSCSTKATRSAGVSVSSTTSKARPTESERTVSCSGSELFCAGARFAAADASDGSP